MAGASLRASGLPASIGESELRAVFRREDQLSNVQVAKDASGACCGYAILDFESEGAAMRALARYNGRFLPGQRSSLKLSASGPGSGRFPLLAYQLCVGNLAASVTDADLFEAFKALSGDVSGARVIRQEPSGKSRGFGFVRLANDKAVDSMLERARGFQVHGVQVTVCETCQQEMPPGADQRSVFLGNLDLSVTECWLREALAVFGELDSVSVNCNPGARCFGFATFADTEGALGAMSLLKDRVLKDREQFRRLHLRWSRPPRAQLRPRGLAPGPGSRFAAPAALSSLEQDDGLGKEYLQSLQPVRQLDANVMRVPGAAMDATDTAYWLSMMMGQIPRDLGAPPSGPAETAQDPPMQEALQQVPGLVAPDDEKSLESFVANTNGLLVLWSSLEDPPVHENPPVPELAAEDELASLEVCAWCRRASARSWCGCASEERANLEDPPVQEGPQQVPGLVAADAEASLEASAVASESQDQAEGSWSKAPASALGLGGYSSSEDEAEPASKRPKN
ncbi:unnamed protein product [Polarella glacialis]|uniref:RRM domain-containing protein n=2 Tax=Polarella glacialis TaxID=89957 RepID=A0A813I769_POLGL|nr:unnamed protein product [Polarella glacialis]